MSDESGDSFKEEMKSLLFAIHYMELGGAEMSLLGLLESLDYSEYEVDLFVYSHRGELMEFIPKEVNLLPEMLEYKQIERPVKDVLKDGCLRIALARLKGKRRFAGYIKSKKGNGGEAIYSYVARNLVKVLPDINPDKEYDIAVSYLMPHDYVLRKVKAKQKVAWIHTDYSKVHVDADLELPVWSGYDKIVSISPDVTRCFLSVFPSLSDKIIERPNVVPVKYVTTKSNELPLSEVIKEMPVSPGRINLLSVGRFCEAKNYDNVPDICSKLRNKGLDVYWYLIGFGDMEAVIRETIAETGMGDYVSILGKKSNPYPYMKACDFYVQPSRYEGSPMTVLEAIALGKQVIMTDFPTAKTVASQSPLCHVVPMDNSGCAEGLYNILHQGDTA